jgi:hypothetical protein
VPEVLKSAPIGFFPPSQVEIEKTGTFKQLQVSVLNKNQHLFYMYRFFKKTEPLILKTGTGFLKKTAPTN